MAEPRIFIFAPADPTGETHRVLEGAGCRLTLGDASWHTPMGNNEEEMVRLASGVDALMGTSIRSSPISKSILQSSEALRIVAKYTIGVDDVDVDSATELGILVTHCPTESNWGGVAEGTMAMMLTLLKKPRERDERVKRGAWRDEAIQGTYLGARTSDDYPGITIGIIGLGRIGSRVADLLAPWRVRLIGYDPYEDGSKFVLHGVKRVDLPTLLRESDVVSLHVVLTKETQHMMGAAELAMMKPSAILINTSRGQVVDEAALADALSHGAISGAALDVFEDEPLLTGSPLRDLGHKVLLSPHMVSSNLGSGLNPALHWATRSVLSALNGEVPDNVYNKEAIPRWLERFADRRLLA
jgi:phosphoglycerate dehydrogenase-like enzyme